MKLSTLPNYITCLRMAGALCLLPIDSSLAAFYIIYTLCGISDVLDGFIARITKSTSVLGSKLDSIADLLFYTVMVIKIFPVLLKHLSVRFWCGVVTMVAIRLISYVAAAIKFHNFASLHTYMNKLTGFSAFMLPYMFLIFDVTLSCTICLSVAMISSVEELFIWISSKSYRTDVKSIFHVWKKEKSIAAG